MVPTPPDESASPPDGDGAIEHVVSHLFDRELEHLAFARPQNEAQRQQSSAAARELARRAADHAARSGEAPATVPQTAPQTVPRTVPPTVPNLAPSLTAAPHTAPRPGLRSTDPAFAPTLAHRDRARGASIPSADGEDARPWWRRTAPLVGAGLLALIVAASILPAGTTEPAASPSLDVFAAEATPEEVTLQRQLVREGLRLSVAPRIIAQRDDTQILAYRLIVTSGAERARNEVCVVLHEQSALGAPQCTERSDFLRDGLLASLTTDSATFVVRWGPIGSADVSELPQNQVALERPRSAAAEALLRGEQNSQDLVYAGLLRALHLDDRLVVRVLASTRTWDAVGALVASADTGLWSYCVHLFQREPEPRPQLGASVTCAGLDAFEGDGIIAQARTAEATLLVEWKPDDTVVVTEAVP